MSSTTPKSIPARIHGVLAGFGLATTLLVILMLLTWLATLEQTVSGLHATLEKYFSHKHFWVFPDAAIFKHDLMGHDKKLPPLPGGFWVCALLVVNLILGGIIRLRKGWRTIGVLMAHFGIVFMIIAGGVAQFKEERGVMMMSETGIAGLPVEMDYAQSQVDSSVEILEVKDGKVAGPVHFIADRHYKDLETGDPRLIRLPGLPFDLQLEHYVQNAKPMSEGSMAAEKGEPVVDKWFLFAAPANNETAADTPGVYARVVQKDGKQGELFMLATPDPADFNGLAAPAPKPFTVRQGDKTFAIRMDKQIWSVPFRMRLLDARTENFPHTTKPKYFESDVMRIENGRESKVFIEMNQPMRYGGWTAYQHTMPGGANTQGGEAVISGFEVVRNPADQWPKYSIYLAGFGLCLHFILKMVNFLSRGSRSSTATKA